MDSGSQNGEAARETTILRTDSVVKTYSKRKVVDDVSIDVKSGEVVGLLGPNGAAYSV